MDLSKTRLIESIFADGGDMGARVHALDWSATVVGPVAEHITGCPSLQGGGPSNANRTGEGDG